MSTSRKQVPATFRLVQKLDGWKPGNINFDFGCGKWPELFTHALATINVHNLYYDPFHHSPRETVPSSLRVVPQTVTLNNVLNVIKNDLDVQGVIQRASSLMNKYSTLYVLIHEGNKSGIGKETRDGFQRNNKAEDYIPFLTFACLSVSRKGSLLICKKEVKYG